MAEFRIETDRLILRGWRKADAASLHAICSDPRVMEFLGPLHTRSEIHAIIERQQAIQADFGACFWAIERHTTSEMIGFCGLQPGPAETPLEGKAEIGWRLMHEAWGQGIAREAAFAALEWGFTHLADPSIWAITVPANIRSWGLMGRLGMVRHFDLDFDHPHLPDDNPLKRHLTYGITRDSFFNAR
jgi:RimJ/RimL family protein N-acetyltransferase